MSTATQTALVKPADLAEGKIELMVLFLLDGQEFGLLADRVKEIIHIRHATRVPNSAGCIEGVINLRGRILPVFNLRRKLGMSQAQENGGTRTVMIVDPESTVPGASADAGLLVDDVADVVRISAQDIDNATSGFSSGGVVEGTVNLGGRLVTLLSMQALLDN